MQKSRELPFFRGASDGYWYASSGNIRTDSPDFGKYMDLYERYAYGLAAANTYYAAPLYIGSQVFSSSERKPPLFNDCNNRKVRGVLLPVTYCNQYYNKAYLYTHAPLAVVPIASGTTASMATPSSPDTLWGGTDECSRRAWWSMQPRFEGEFQALNFIYELKDFKDIAKHISKLSLKNVVASVKKAKRGLDHALKRVKQNTAGRNLQRFAANSTKVMAEVWLTKQFVIDPTARDLMNLHAQLVTLISEVQQEFFDRGKELQSSHYTETLHEVESTSVGINNYYWQKYGTYSTAVFTASMQYRYDYKMRSHWDALKRYYGLNLNAGVVWNALPFSFVLDYFIKVGQAIDFMNTDPNVELRLAQYCESVLVTVRAGTLLRADARANVLINGGASIKEGIGSHVDGELIAGYEGTWYSRKVKSPNKGAATPRLSLPSTLQTANLAALVRMMW